MLMYDAKESPMAFPKKADKKRIEQYAFYDKLYSGDHFDAFSIKGERDFTERYNRLRYVVAPFAGLISRVVVDMLFGEKVTIDVNNDQNQKFIDGLMEKNQLITQLYESGLGNSRRGDSIFKLRIGQRRPSNPRDPQTLIMEEINPSIYFPQLGPNDPRYTPSEEVLAWTFAGPTGIVYLHKEIHKPGFIFHEVYNYSAKDERIVSQVNSEQFGFPAMEETGVDRPLIFHIPNVRDGGGFWGTSDYRDLIQLFFAINNRLTKSDNILDKHSDPILAVPPGMIDENGKIKKESINMFEFDEESGAKPEYIVWNANLEAAEHEIDKLIQILLMVSEVAPAALGVDKEGMAESGRALKFKLLSTIRKRNRKIRYYDQAIKDMLETAQQLAVVHSIAIDGNKVGTPERPTIDWGDGVIADETEMVDTAVKRVDAGLSSRADEIAKLDGKTPDEAKKKVKEIDEESTADVTALVTGGKQMDKGGGQTAMPPANNNMPPARS